MSIQDYIEAVTGKTRDQRRDEQAARHAEFVKQCGGECEPSDVDLHEQYMAEYNAEELQ